MLARGQPVRNPAPPACVRTPCWNQGAGHLRLRFQREDAECYRRWQLCRAFRVLPLPGALGGQNPWDMERFRLLEICEQTAERSARVCPFGGGTK